MDKVFIGFPTGGMCRASFTKSLCDLAIFELTAKNDKYEIINPDYTESIYISENRNELVYKAREAKADWLLSIDTDNGFPQILLRVLMRTADPITRPVIFGLYSNIGRVNADNSWEMLDAVYAETEDGTYRNIIPGEATEPFAVDAAGTGVLLVHMSVFEKYEYPWFFTPYFSNPTTGEKQFMNEDIAWCRTVRELGVPLYCDPMVDLIHWKTIPLLTSQYKALYDKALAVKKEMDAKR